MIFHLYKIIFLVLLPNLYCQNSISELVNVKDIIPSIELDIKYATTDNFTEQKLNLLNTAL